MFEGFDPIILARIQFGFTVSFHFIFPSFSIELASYLAVLEGLWLRTGKPVYLDLFNFWVKIFAVAFVMGLVSGIVMSYQFGTNWSVFSDKTGPVLRPLMADEVLAAFFLEAGFLGVYYSAVKRWGRSCISQRPVWLRSAPSSLLSGFCRPTTGCRPRPATQSMRAGNL